MSFKRALSLMAAAAVCVSLVGCSGLTASPASAPTPALTQPPTPTPSPSPTPTPSPACSAALVLTQVRPLLAGQDFEAHYLTIGDRLTLSVWLVDPEIDPATPKSGLAAAGRMAAQRGLSVSYEIVDQIPCVRQIFDQVNPMIVDARFQHWYKDFLPVSAFEGLHDPTTDQLIAAVKATGSAPEPRSRAPQAAHTPAAGSCAWPAARAAIHAYLGSGDNTAVYVIIGAGSVEQPSLTAGTPEDVGIEVQWPVSDVADAADSVVRERLGHVVVALACYRHAVDWLEAFVVDPSGRTLVYALVPGSIIQAGAVPLPPDGVRICHLSGPVCTHGSPGSEGLPAGS